MVERKIAASKPVRNNLCSSFQCAFEGLWYVLRAERNARIHLTVAILVVLMGAWLRLSEIEWVLIVAAIGLVFAGEMLNTVVELTVDLITLEQNPVAKRAKDVAAGAVLVAAVVAAIMGLIILGPPFWTKLSSLWR